MNKPLSIKLILVLPFLALNSSCNSESKKEVEQDLTTKVTDRISPNIFMIIFKSRQEKTDKTDLPKNLPSDISHLYYINNFNLFHFLELSTNNIFLIFIY